MTASPRRGYSGHHRVAEEEDDPGTLEILSVLHYFASLYQQMPASVNIHWPDRISNTARNVDSKVQMQLEKDGGGSHGC